MTEPVEVQWFRWYARHPKAWADIMRAGRTQ